MISRAHAIDLIAKAFYAAQKYSHPWDNPETSANPWGFYGRLAQIAIDELRDMGVDVDDIIELDDGDRK